MGSISQGPPVTCIEEVGGVRRSSSELNELRRAMDGVLIQWERVRKEWSDKLAEMEVRGNLVNPVLKTVIELFCSQDEASIAEIEGAFELFPDDVIFFAPQLCIYLLYSPSPISFSLKASILHLCSVDAILAHKMHFYLRSFAVNDEAMIENGLQSLIHDIIQFGDIATRKGQRDRSIANDFPIAPPTLNPRFQDNVTFWSRLVEVTRILSNRRTKYERTEELQKQLLMWGNDLLPSASIFVPVGNCRNRVWAVHALECFAFSTKSRVPIFVCLEVIEYSRPKR